CSTTTTMKTTKRALSMTAKIRSRGAATLTRTGSVQQGCQAHARRRDTRVVGARDLEVVEQSGADAVAILGRGLREQVEETGEGVLEVSAAHVEVGDRELRVHVARPRGGGVTELARARAGQALEQRHLGEAGDRELVAGVLGDRLAVLGDRGRVVARRDGAEGLLV